MARVTIRELLRFRPNLLTLNPSKTTLFSSSSSSSSSISSEKTKITLYHPSLYLFQKCHNMRQLLQVQAHLTTSGRFRTNLFLASRVLKRSAELGDVDYAVLVFRCIESPDAFCVNTVIKAYASSCNPHGALVLYFEMLKNGFLHNSFAFPPLFGACAEMGCSKSGQKCHGQAVKYGVDCVLPVQNSLINMYACFELIEIACKVFGEMSERDVVSWNSIVHGYVKAGDLSAAHHVFDVMPERNVASWNIMIGGYAKGGNPGCGLKVFRKMVGTGLRGNDKTVVSIVTACGQSARMREGKSVHGYLIRIFPTSNLIIDTALIDMYSRFQRVDLACRVFERMVERNLVCWNAMILGHCIHGNPEDGIDLFEKMVNYIHKSTRAGKEQEVLPDGITFIGVLCACARVGLLTDGRRYFSQMVDVYGIKANFAHYWCMANLFAGVGMIQEAVEVLRNMSFDDKDLSSESTVWAGLLGSCRFHGNVTLGEQIANSLIELEPQNFFCHALLLNVYAVAGRWEDVVKVKEMMKERGLRRLPGCNLVDLKEIVHKLKVGDKWWHETGEATLTIGKLTQKPSLYTGSTQYPPLHGTEAGG